MKLRNKKTGEIGYTAVLQSKAIVVMDENAIQLGSFNSLAKLNAEWEDYEEPKSWWYIDCNGEVFRGENADKEHTEEHKSIGNYYTSSEEAEKAVEKLKAWKRLKDKGFEAVSSSICGSEFVANFKLVDKEDYSQSMDDFDCILDLGDEE